MKFYKGNNGLLLSLLNAESDLKEVRVGTVDASLEKHVPVVEVEGNKVATRYDYKLSEEEDLINGKELKINLPKSNVLKYILENGSSFVVRPSGTEPKMKIYLAVKGTSLEDAEKQNADFKKAVMDIINEKLK